jgi:basic amino acid/polyamine antiporter, APA family
MTATEEPQEPGRVDGGEAEGVFIRQSTGLVRLMGTRQTVVYNTMITTIVLGAALTFLLAPYAFPGANIWLGVLITGVLGAFMMGAYAMLGASMPRSGGDYVFQSRLVNSGFGFVLVIVGFVIFLAFWMCLAGWFLGVMALSPFATTLGIQVHAQWLVTFGTWAATPWGITWISLGGLLLTLLVLARGIRMYLRLQTYLWVGLLITFVTCWILLITHSHTGFINTFNHYLSRTNGSHQNYYGAILASAKKAGYPGDHFSLWQTIGVAPVVWTAMAWCMWSVITSGELKGARVLKNHMIGMQGALAIVTVTIAVTAFLLVHSAGDSFIGSLGFLYYSGAPGLTKLPAPPFFGVLTAMLTTSPIVIILLAIGFITTAFQIMIGMAWGASRILMSMAFDRVLPERLGNVNERTRTPVGALLVIMVLSVIFVFLYNHTAVAKYTLAVTLTSVLTYMGSMVAAIVFPYRAPDLFKASPAAKYRIAGIPTIVILGVIGFAFNALLVYFYLTKDALFVNDTGSIEMIVGIYIATTVYFYGRRLWLKRSGYDPTIAFSRIPPE